MSVTTSALAPDHLSVTRAELVCSFWCLQNSDRNEFKPKNLQTEEKESKGPEDTTGRDRSM